MKNRYHPLLKQKFFLGILSDYEILLINKRTYYSWNHISEDQLTGFNPNDPLIEDKAVFAFTHSHKHVRDLLKVYMTLFSCFRALTLSLPNLNEKLRNQKTRFIDAYNFCKQYISAKKFHCLTGISPQKINRWQNEIFCQGSVLEKCVIQNPHQLTLEEQNIVARELQHPANEHLFKCDLWAKLLRSNILRCKLSTFYKYSFIISQKLGLVKQKMKKPVSEIIAKAPLTVLHVDCTIVKTYDGGKWYINVIFDNFSKAILGIVAMKTPNSFEVMLNLKKVIREYDLEGKRFSLYCDGGPENKGFTDILIKDHRKIRKFVTSFCNGIHNNMLESFNSKLKRKLFLLLDLSAHEKVPQQLPGFKKTYNNMYLSLLSTLSPNEVLKGLIPEKDVWPDLEINIEEAKNTRLLTNMISCCK